MTKTEAQLDILSSSRNILTISGSAIVISTTLLKDTIIISNANGFHKYIPLILYFIGGIFLCISICLYYSILTKTIKYIDDDCDSFNEPISKIKLQLIFFVIGLLLTLLGLCANSILKSEYPSENIQTIKILKNEK